MVAAAFGFLNSLFLVRRWGIAERHGPGQYDFGAYKHLLNMCKEAGLKMQVRRLIELLPSHTMCL